MPRRPVDWNHLEAMKRKLFAAIDLHTQGVQLLDLKEFAEENNVSLQWVTKMSQQSKMYKTIGRSYFKKSLSQQATFDRHVWSLLNGYETSRSYDE